MFIANLICYSKLGYQVLFTSKRIIGQTRASYEQNGFSVWYCNKRRNLKNKHGSCSQHIHEKSDKIWFGRFTGDAFNSQFNLNVSMKLLKTFFVYKCKLSLALLYLADMFINKHKSKLNGFFTERFWIEKEFTTFFDGMSPQELNKCPDAKFYFVAKKTWWPIHYLRAKIEIIDSNIWVENHHFCAQLSQCFGIYTKNYS